MRLLVTDHAPADSPEAAIWLYDMARRLSAAGHEVQWLTLDDRQRTGAPIPVTRVICKCQDPRADLDFDVPCFSANSSQRLSFESLSERQINDYRNALRRALDRLMAKFDPQIIHTSSIWMQSHLALEAGVPYVVSTSGIELAGYAADPRFRRYAEESAENAGRILVPDSTIRQKVLDAFGPLGERVLALDELLSGRDPEQQILGIYRAVLSERFGAIPGT